jgi:hypothetical protein
VYLLVVSKNFITQFIAPDKVIIIPTSLKAFVLNAQLEAGFLFKQIESDVT